MTRKCCNERSMIKGILYGALPHSFCILFIIFSIAGSAVMASLLKPFFLNSSFFYLLIAFSFFAATVSAFFYFRKNGKLSLSGLLSGKRYLAVLYGTTFIVNMILFILIFPVAANMSSGLGLKSSIAQAFWADTSETADNFFWAEVDIPCSGHSPLISEELRGLEGVEKVIFSFPNVFKVEYNPEIVSKEEILSLEIFKTYPIKMR